MSEADEKPRRSMGAFDTTRPDGSLTPLGRLFGVSNKSHGKLPFPIGLQQVEAVITLGTKGADARDLKAAAETLERTSNG